MIIVFRSYFVKNIIRIIGIYGNFIVKEFDIFNMDMWVVIEIKNLVVMF